MKNYPKKAQPKLKETPLSIFTEHESTRTWGDELCNDLLYTILLRRQHTKNSGDGLQWETKKIKVRKISQPLLPKLGNPKLTQLYQNVSNHAKN